MANQDQLNVIVEATSAYQRNSKPGLPLPSEVWNRWREDNPHVKPDLKGGLGLPTQLASENIYFDGINLRDADLSWCVVIRSYMNGADLRRANLLWVRFDHVNLKGADFSHANLKGAVFNDCNLDGANFTGAQMDRAVFANADISSCKGLDTITIPQGEAQKPITIGVDTLKRSKGVVPERLLQLAGISEEVRELAGRT